MGEGDFACDVPQILASGVLVCAFALLTLRRPRRLVGALALQGACLAAFAAWQGWVRAEWAPLGAATLILAGGAAVVPAALRVVLAQPAAPCGLALVARPAAILAGGVVLVASLTVVLDASIGRGSTANGGATVWGLLMLAATVLLLGLLVGATRRGPSGQVVGLCCATRGALLLVLSVPDMPLMGLLVLGVTALEAGLVSSRMPVGAGWLILARGAASGAPVRERPEMVDVAPARRFSRLSRAWTRRS